MAAKRIMTIFEPVPTNVRPSVELGTIPLSSPLDNPSRGALSINELDGITATGEGYLLKRYMPLRHASDQKKTRSSKMFGVRWSYIRDTYRKSGPSLLRCRKIPAGIWVTDNFSNNYYHWLSKELPKALAAADALPDIPVIIPEVLWNVEFIRTTLEILLPGRVELVEAGSSAFVRRLNIVAHGQVQALVHPVLFEKIRQAVLDSLPQTVEERAHQENVYISRRKAKSRRLENERDIEPVLEAHGYQIVDAEKLTFLEQVRVMMNAKRLISPHGAGLTNMLFMPSGGKIMEIRQRANPDCFILMASTLGHTHYSLPCTQVHPSKAPNHAQVLVKVSEFEKAIRDFAARA
jgi:capsular polysaccharide biosynthesis protein